MIVHLNGEAHKLSPGTTLPELIGTTGLDPRGVAIERNLVIVKKSEWPTTVLEHGDRLEIVQFVGGGL